MSEEAKEQSHTTVYDNVYDEVSHELLADVHPDFDRNIIKVRCVSCKKAIQTTLGELRMKFPRGSDWLTMNGRLHFRLPFTKIEFTITCWSRRVRYIK